MKQANASMPAEFPTLTRSQAAPQPVASDIRLPEGWVIAEYSGKDGRAVFAVYSNGRRMASGMTSAQSAARWARLLASSPSVTA